MKPRKRILTKTLIFRVTPDQNEAIEAYISLYNVTKSQALRALLAQNIYGVVVSSQSPDISPAKPIIEDSIPVSPKK